MNLKEAEKEFEIFAKQYDLNFFKMKRKYEHSYRVMENAGKIAESLNLNKDEIELAKLIGLLHDIGHFETIKRNDILKENIKIDHGDLGVEILQKNSYIRKFIQEEKYDSIILKAIKSHNKFKIEEGLSEKELLFARIIRDADKLDIFLEGAEIFWTKREQIDEINNSTVSNEIFNDFKNNCLIDRKNIKTKLDGIISFIGQMYDINFKYDFEVIKKEDYINKILNKFNIQDKKTSSQISEVRTILTEYIEKQL